MKITQELYNQINEEINSIDETNLTLEQIIDKKLEIYEKYGVNTKITPEQEEMFDDAYRDYFRTCKV